MRILLFINNKFTIFANRLTTNEDMNRTETINNALNMRGLKTAHTVCNSTRLEPRQVLIVS